MHIYPPFYSTGYEEWKHSPILTHELAHYWDQADGYLSSDMLSWVNWGEPSTRIGALYPGSPEDFAEAVDVYFWPEMDEGRLWTDDVGAGLALAGGIPDSLRITGTDRYGNSVDNASCLVLVKDRYDWVQLKLTGVWK